MTPLAILAAAATSLAVGLVVASVVPPPRRLRGRIEPYLTPSQGLTAGAGASGWLGSVFGPILRDLADWVGTRLDRSGAGTTLVRLRQAGWFKGMPEDRMLGAFRAMQLKSLALAVVSSLLVGQVLGLSITMRTILLGLGIVIGGSRVRGKLERSIESRRELMKIEIYTVNQLMAMRVRAGGGVIQAVKSTVERGSGEVVAELDEALRLHRSGWRGPDAFRRIAELTPEPFCSRTYRLLAAAEERGADLAGALLSLSEDVREMRRESIKRKATKRRAAMLIPTIAILAPVLILFVAAPLPYLITGWQ